MAEKQWKTAIERTRSDGSIVHPGEIGYEYASQHAEEVELEEPPLNQHLLAHLKRVETMVKRYHERLREEERLDNRNFRRKSNSDHPHSERQGQS